MPNPTVTFDSNVWENIVDENKRVNNTIYNILYKSIVKKEVTPFFFEGIVTTETIPKKYRKDYFKNYKATISFQINNEKPTIRKGTKAPELTPYLKDNIPKALNLGFKFIKFPRIGGIGIKIDEKYIAKDKNYSLKERLERSFEFAKYVETLGAGKKQLENKLDGNSDKGIINQTKNDNNTNQKQYAKGIAEWVDADVLSAHYGYGIDYFCTNDKASGAGESSIFSEKNLNKIKKKYNLKIVTPSELINLVSLDV